MSEKVLLILVDGMRPDAILQCRHPFLVNLMRQSTYTLKATTVKPAITLPAHMSLFYSVDPERHGITGNTWVPPVRPIDGIADVVAKHDKTAAFFYNWEQLRDLARPGSLKCSYYMNNFLFPDTDSRVTDKAMEFIKEVQPDFTFLYLGNTDETGHAYGWMGKEYMEVLAKASECIERIFSMVHENYSVIVTADHGGHERNHGVDIPEDMTTPLILYGKPFEKGKILPTANIKDIAPTIASIMDLPAPREWNGSCLI